MHKNKRLVPFIGLGLVVALSLTGCDLSLDPDSSAPAPNPPATSTPTPTAQAQDDEEVDENELSPECIKFFEELKQYGPMPGAAHQFYYANKGDCLDEPTAGVLNADGTLEQLPLYYGGDEIVTVDSTTNTSTPPLIAPASYGVLDGTLRYQNITTSWAELVERVEGQPDQIRQAYIDGINKYSSESGFDWEDVLVFAKMKSVEARIIQVFNVPVSEMSDDQVRNSVRPYMGDAADDLQIMRIMGSFVNTTNIGSGDHLQMGKFGDAQRMIRVSLTPILLDEHNKPILRDGQRQLDVSRGAGIFIDCLNLHWVPPMYVCPDSICEPPDCPSGWTGTWPVCKDPASNDPGATGVVPPWGTGLNPGTGGAPASPPAAGDPPPTYVDPDAPPASNDPPVGSDEDDAPPPPNNEGGDNEVCVQLPGDPPCPVT